MAEWLAVLVDPTRLRLLSLIAAAGEVCAACHLVDPLGVSQPTVSHHLKVLHETGLVAREKRGRWVYYQPVPKRLRILSRALAPETVASPGVTPTAGNRAYDAADPGLARRNPGATSMSRYV